MLAQYFIFCYSTFAEFVLVQKPFYAAVHCPLVAAIVFAAVYVVCSFQKYVCLLLLFLMSMQLHCC